MTVPPGILSSGAEATIFAFYLETRRKRTKVIMKSSTSTGERNPVVFRPPFVLA